MCKYLADAATRHRSRLFRQKNLVGGVGGRPLFYAFGCIIMFSACVLLFVFERRSWGCNGPGCTPVCASYGISKGDGMADYLKMDAAALREEQARLQEEYKAFQARGLKLDMSRGKPSPEQLDISMPLLGMQDYMDEDGTDTRNYGGLEGCSEARRFFGGMMGTQPGETFVGGCASLSLIYGMMDLGWRQGFGGAKPWKDCGKIKFICPSPGYDRHFRISEGFGFELVMVDMTPDGPDMDAVEALALDESVKGIWCVPVYSNPDGYTCSDETVRRLASMKTGAPDFRVFWDNSYGVHHLGPEHEEALNLLAACKEAGNPERALIFCSTSKITFAGAGVGALGASEKNIADAVAYYFPMLICFDKVNQLRHVRFLQQQGLENVMEKHAALLRPKFRVVQDTFGRELAPCGEIAHWTDPKGGYFVSLYVMDGCAGRVVQLCHEAGVVLTGAGAAFPHGHDPRDRHIRIAPSFPPVEELKTAAELLCVATRLACCEKILEA